MADDNILPLVLIGGGAYLLYKWLAPAAAAAPAATTTGAAAPAAPATTAAAPGAGSLDQIYQRFQVSIQQNASTDPAISVNQGPGGRAGFYQATPYVFNSYLARAGGFDLSSQISTLFPNGTDQQPISMAQFWSVAAAWLAQNKGLSGLGFYGTFFSKVRR